MNATMNEEKIKIINVRNSATTLRVYVIPSLSWKHEFEHVKQKIKGSI